MPGMVAKAADSSGEARRGTPFYPRAMPIEIVRGPLLIRSWQEPDADGLASAVADSIDAIAANATAVTLLLNMVLSST